MKMYRIVALFKKEFGQLFKDKKLLPLVFVAPVLQLVFMGFAASLDVKNISVVLCDLDKSQTSRELTEKFTNSGYFTIDYSTDNYQTIQKYLDDHKTMMALVIPPKFGDDVARHQTAKVQVLLDGSEGNTTAIAMGYVNQIIGSYSNNILAETVGKAPIGGINAQIRTWFNASLKSRNYMVPGVLVMILLITTMNLTSMAVVKEKEIGTLEQLMVTPITPTELIIGKVVPFTLIGVVNWFVVLSAMVFGFGIPVKGSVPLLFGLSSFFILSSLGLGLFVSTISRTQQQAMMTAQFFILQPMIYVSGFTFPIDNLPRLLKILSFGIPMRYYLVVVRSIVLKGVGISSLWLEACMLLLMGVMVLIASIVRFKSKLD